MAVIGGPVESIAFAGRSFSVAQDSDPTRDIGGSQNTIEMNGDGTARVLQERMPWKFGPVGVQIDDDRFDQEFIQDQKDEGAEKDFSLTLADGAIYYGSGTIVDATERSSKNAIMDVTFSGPGKLTKQ